MGDRHADVLLCQTVGTRPVPDLAEKALVDFTDGSIGQQIERFGPTVEPGQAGDDVLAFEFVQFAAGCDVLGLRRPMNTRDWSAMDGAQVVQMAATMVAKAYGTDRATRCGIVCALDFDVGPVKERPISDGKPRATQRTMPGIP